MATSDAPVSIGQVALTVNNLDAMKDFYRDVMGLGLIHNAGDTAVLGIDDRPLIALRQDRAARPHTREAGLFHTAFLVPSRQDLGGWLIHSAGQGTQLDGASDHGVSEALYLTDPEGNGIEIYHDLPRDSWQRSGDRVAMFTKPLDLQALAKDAAPWQDAPAGTVIGHVHLRVGNVDQAADFITEELGMVQTFELPDARWFGAGGYHHHLATNAWQSRGAGRRSTGATGLAEIELIADPDVLRPNRLTDPWGTEFTITGARAQDA